MAEDEDLEGEPAFRERSLDSRVADVRDQLVVGERVELMFGALAEGQVREGS